MSISGHLGASYTLSQDSMYMYMYCAHDKTSNICDKIISNILTKTFCIPYVYEEEANGY